MFYRSLCTSFALTLGLLAAGCQEDDASDGSGGAGGGGGGGAEMNANQDGGVSAMPDSSANRDAASTPAGDAASAVDPDAKVGEFSIQLVAPVPAPAAGGTDTPGFTAILGTVFDGPSAPTLVWEERERADGCTLLQPRVPFCEQSCGSDVCVEDDVCQRRPVSRSAGTLTVTGLQTASGPMTFSIDPIRNAYQTPGSIKLPYPAFAEGDAIELSAAGGEVGAFTLTGKGIAPLVLSSEAAYPVVSGQPLELGWTAATMPGLSRIHVKLDISHHGGTKGKIECETEDDGSLSIPAAMITTLIGYGTAGFPTIVVTRQATSTTSTPLGKVNLRVYSYVEREVQIPGVVSCTEQTDCQAGETCRDDKTCG